MKKGLHEVVPKRRHRSGCKPGLTNPEIVKRVLSKSEIEKKEREREDEGDDKIIESIQGQILIITSPIYTETEYEVHKCKVNANRFEREFR